MWIPILGLLIGIILGLVIPIQIPTAYASYMSIAVLAALDSVIWWNSASLEKNLKLMYSYQVFSECIFSCRPYLYRG